MDEVEIRPLCIAFMGYNLEQTTVCFRQFARDNAESIKAAKPNRLVLKDGTMILPFPAARVRVARMDGYRFDQLIIADDRRKNIYHAAAAEIRRIIGSAMIHSCVPGEYQIQFYDIDEPIP